MRLQRLALVCLLLALHAQRPFLVLVRSLAHDPDLVRLTNLRLVLALVLSHVLLSMHSLVVMMMMMIMIRPRYSKGAIALKSDTAHKNKLFQ